MSRQAASTAARDSSAAGGRPSEAGHVVRTGRRAPSPRVLQVVLSLNPGGTERLVVELAARLAPELPMAVCCLDEPGTWASELEQRGVPVTSLSRRAGFHPALALQIASVASRHQADVLHCHHYSPFVYSALAKLVRPGARVIFTEHGRLSDSGPSPKRRIANHILSRLPRRVFAVSDELRQHIVAEGFSAASVGVIYNGIDVGPPADATMRGHVRRELGIADDALVVGTIARLDPVKNLETLLQAVAVCGSHRPTALIVVGDGPERGRLAAAVQEIGIQSSVRFLGQRNDARRWLAGCDVYVNSSISEGVSLTILEAMAAGLPIVATRVGGTPEVVDAASGILVPARDPAALAGALIALAAQPDGRARMGDAGRLRVETRFSLDRMIAEYRDVYQQVVA